MIGLRIRDARRARTKSQGWLAEQVGVNQSAVSHWEQGKTEPTTANLSSIAQELRISFEWLTTGRGEMDVSYAPVSLHVAEPSAYVDEDIKEVVSLFQQLPKKKREVLLQFMRDWVNTK